MEDLRQEEYLRLSHDRNVRAVCTDFAAKWRIGAIGVIAAIEASDNRRNYKSRIDKHAYLAMMRGSVSDSAQLKELPSPTTATILAGCGASRKDIGHYRHYASGNIVTAYETYKGPK